MDGTEILPGATDFPFRPIRRRRRGGSFERDSRRLRNRGFRAFHAEKFFWRVLCQPDSWAENHARYARVAPPPRRSSGRQTARHPAKTARRRAESIRARFGFKKLARGKFIRAAHRKFAPVAG